MKLKLWTGIAVALLAAPALAACGGGGHTHAGGTGQSTTSTAARTTTTSAQSRGIVTVDGVAQEARLAHYQLTIYDLRREGPYVVLDFGIVCQEPASVGCGSRFDFSIPGQSHEAFAGLNEPSGVALVDPVANKLYSVVADSQLHPQASELPFQSINDDSLHLAWVKFPAPPSTTRTVDVVFPHGGPQIPLVPISNTAATLPTNLGPHGTPDTPGPGSQPANSTTTAGMTLPVTNLITTVGNPTGSDAESANRATITLRTDVLFHFAKSDLTPRARAILGQVGAKIKSRAVGPVQVAGYTDSIGTDQVNIPLSRARAAAVVKALQPQAPGVTFHASGLGSADPVAPNTKANGADNPAGRALNRRVTIRFSVHAPAPPTPPAPAAPATTPAAGTVRMVNFKVPGDTQNSWRVGIDGISRAGNLAVMKLSITCTREAGNSCNGATDFIGSQSVPPITFTKSFLASGLNAFWTLGGFYLTDPTSGTEYIPVYLGASNPLTSPLSNNMAAGESYPLWIYFPAPPVSTVTVSLPGGSPRVEDVPVTAATR